MQQKTRECFVSSEKKNPSSKEWPSFPDVNLDSWNKAAQKSAPNGDVNQLGWKTPDGIHLKALYTEIGRAHV